MMFRSRLDQIIEKAMERGHNLVFKVKRVPVNYLTTD